MDEQKVAIDNASLEELKTLDGIGDVRAQAIIDHRNKNGEFQSIEDIKNVRGIGDKTYDRIKDKITLYDKSEIQNKRINEVNVTKNNTVAKVENPMSLKNRVKLEVAMRIANRKEMRLTRKAGRLLYLNDKKQLLKRRINAKKAKVRRFIDKLSYYRISEIKKRISLRIEAKRERIQKETEEKLALYAEQQKRMASLNATNKQLLDQLLGREEIQAEMGEVQTAKVR